MLVKKPNTYLVFFMFTDVFMAFFRLVLKWSDNIAIAIFHQVQIPSINL